MIIPFHQNVSLNTICRNDDEMTNDPLEKQFLRRNKYYSLGLQNISFQHQQQRHNVQQSHCRTFNVK